MISKTQIDKGKKRLTTPRAAAVAGIISGMLFLAVQLILRLQFPAGAVATGEMILERTNWLTIILRLLPFAGIFFLWFLGVTRDHLGQWEDRFFATVLLGSGLLYLSMTFNAGAMGGGMLASYNSLEPAMREAIFQYSQATVNQINHVYGVRMAAVFMLSSATLWYRTGVMPRWLALLTYVLGLGLLLLVNLSLWVTLIFPVWMLAVSIMILIINYRRTSEDTQEPVLGESQD